MMPASPIMAVQQTAAASYLLDTYTGASLAVSGRKLKSGVTNFEDILVGATTQTFGFAGDVLDSSAILSFAGSNPAYVKKVYDQSGSGNDLIQTIANNYPRIANAGAIEVDAGFAGLGRFGLVSPWSAFLNLTTPFTVAANYFYVFGVSYFNTSRDLQVLVSNTSGAGVIRFSNTSATTVKASVYSGSSFVIDGGSISTPSLKSYCIEITPTVINVYVNNVLVQTNPVAVTFNNPLTRAFGVDFSTTMTSVNHELIVYQSDQSANRAAITANQMSYYGIT